jgi:hypothetical protein
VAVVGSGDYSEIPKRLDETRQPGQHHAEIIRYDHSHYSRGSTLFPAHGRWIERHEAS